MSDYNSSLTGQQIEDVLTGAVVYNKNMVLTEEQRERARKNIGAGTSDSGLKILGYYATANALANAVLNPKAGDAYGVGSAAPYDIYIWDAVNSRWVNNGNIRGADGKDADLSDAEPMKHKFADVRIAPAAYVADDTYPDFPFRAAIPLEGINETMTPCVTFDVAEAIGGMFAPVAECYNGGVYIYAESAPNYEIIIPTIICWEGVYAVDDPAADKLIISYNDLKALVQNEVNAAGEAATQAQTYAEQAKSYADEAKAGNVADGAVTAEKIAAGAVTREKLAQDALYSPIMVCSGSSYDLSQNECGKTLINDPANSSILKYHIGKGNSQWISSGSEFAFISFDGQGVNLCFWDNILIALPGESSLKNAPLKLRISENYGMVALKKLYHDPTNGDVWLVTGNVEVVS